MYERQDGSGLEVGSYAHRPILHDPDEIPSIEEAALSPTELPFTEDDFVQQMEHALELMPEIVGDESVGIKYAINGLLSLTPGRPADPRRDARGQGPLVGRRGLGQGRPRRGRALAEWMVEGEPEIDLQASDVARFHEHQKSVAHVRARAVGGLQQDLRDRPPGRAVGVRPRRAAVALQRARARARRGLLRGRRLGAPALVRVQRAAGRGVRGRAGREAEWDSRWWSPIINAEHLAMRDRAAIFDLTAFCVFDVVGPGALESVQRVSMRQMDVKLGKVVYTPVLTPRGGFRSDLTIMRLADDRFRVVTGGAHGMADLKWFADHLPRTAPRRSSTSPRSWCTLGLWGPRARDILAAHHQRRRLARGLPVRHLPDDRDRPAAGARVAHLLRRRPRLGAVRADRAGRAAVGHDLGGRRAARRRARRHRRLRHHRAAREVLPRLRLRARRRVRRGRGRHGVGQGQGRGLRRQGGARAPSRDGPGGGDVHADGRRPHRRRRAQALHARRRADPDPRRRAADRRARAGARS